MEGCANFNSFNFNIQFWICMLTIRQNYWINTHLAKYLDYYIYIILCFWLPRSSSCFSVPFSISFSSCLQFHLCSLSFNPTAVAPGIFFKGICSVLWCWKNHVGCHCQSDQMIAKANEAKDNEDRRKGSQWCQEITARGTKRHCWSLDVITMVANVTEFSTLLTKLT